MKNRRKKKIRRRKPKCRGMKVWPYPRTTNNEGRLDWAWACMCGGRGHGLTQDAAHEAADVHMEAADE